MSSKEAILSRLRGAATLAHTPHGWQPWRGEDGSARRERFVAGISASHAEILTVKEANLARIWPSGWMGSNNASGLWPGVRWQAAVAVACAGRSVLTPAGEFASWKDDLFDVCQAGITHCAGPSPIPAPWCCCQMAASRAPYPWCPLPYRPAGGLHHRRQPGGAGGGRALAAGHAHQSVAGFRPSKTADIQQTLAYGAHGPSRLLVVLVEDC